MERICYQDVLGMRETMRETCVRGTSKDALGGCIRDMSGYMTEMTSSYLPIFPSASNLARCSSMISSTVFSRNTSTVTSSSST